MCPEFLSARRAQAPGVQSLTFRGLASKPGYSMHTQPLQPPQAAPVRCACTPDRRPLCQAYSRGQQLRGELVPLPPTVFARLARAGRSAALVLAGKWDGVGRLCGTRAGDVETAIEGGGVRRFLGGLDQIEPSSTQVDPKWAQNRTQTEPRSTPDRTQIDPGSTPRHV